MTRKLLVLDLDNTLIASDVDFDRYYDIHVPDSGVFTSFRPYAREFLKNVNKYFDIGIWTAATRSYAEPIVNKLFHGLGFMPLFLNCQEDCVAVVVEVNGSPMYGLAKPISKLPWPIEHILIVDDLKYTFAFNVENGIHIEAWKRSTHSDNELLTLLNWLYTIIDVGDVRGIAKFFHEK